MTFVGVQQKYQQLTKRVVDRGCHSGPVKLSQIERQRSYYNKRRDDHNCYVYSQQPTLLPLLVASVSIAQW